MENQNLGEAVVVEQAPHTPFSKRNILIGVGIFILLLVIASVTYVLQMKKQESNIVAVPTLIPTAIPTLAPSLTPVASEAATPTMDPTTINWTPYTDKYVSFRYPKDWTAVAKDDVSLGHQVTIANKDQSVVIRVLSGRQSYNLGSEADIVPSDITVIFDNKTYYTREQIVNDKEVFADFKAASKNNQEYQILFGSGYPTGETAKADRGLYNDTRDTLLKILATFMLIK